LVSGDIWGEDLLLSNESLRHKDVVCSLSYLSVLSLHVRDLVGTVANFPEARARLRWAQVQLAAARGVMAIARAAKDRNRNGNFDLKNLDARDRLEFFANVLRGKRRKEASIMTARSFLGADTSARPIIVTATASTRNERRVGPGGVGIDDRLDRLVEMVASLSERIDGIVDAPARSVSPTDTLGPLSFDKAQPHVRLHSSRTAMWTTHDRVNL